METKSANNQTTDMQSTNKTVFCVAKLMCVVYFFSDCSHGKVEKNKRAKCSFFFL